MQVPTTCFFFFFFVFFFFRNNFFYLDTLVYLVLIMICFVCLEILPSPCNPSPCLNEGDCSESGDNFTCTCSAGFTGNICEIGKLRQNKTLLCVNDTTVRK